MKTCTKCNQAKTLEDFPRNKNRKDGRSAACLVCARKANKSHYERNREYYYDRNKKAKIKNKEKMIEYLLQHPCVDCGEDDVLVLEFDHIDGKTACVTEFMANNTWNKTLKEIEKCEVRCCNCHRKITRKRVNDWRWVYINAS